MEVLWEKSSNLIKEKISRQNFDTWIQPLKISSVEGETVNLSVPNKFFRDWLIENYLTVIRDSLSSAAGIDVKVIFTIDKSGDGLVYSAAVAGENREKKPAHPRPKDQRMYSSLNPNYTFERFVVGSCNQFAHAACMSVAEQPAKNYNPLFIYGGVGLGKTHLLNAIGLHTLSMNNGKHVLYVSAEEFMNELISCIRFDKMQIFREKFRYIDYLLIDDIQFIAGKERTQEEFFHTFNTLHDSGKQIVVTSDKFPKDIPNLEGRLRSRFEWGLVADIQPPEIETKIAIIRKKAQENDIMIPQNVEYYIASKSESSIRELEGFLIRIAAYSSLTGRQIDMNLVKEVLNKVMKHGESKEITIDEVLKAVSAKFGVKVSDLKSDKRNKNLVIPRQMAMFLCRKMTGESFPDIGSKIGGKDHSTVIYANNKMKKLVEEDPKIKRLAEEIENELRSN